MELKSNWSEHKREEVVRWLSIAATDREAVDVLVHSSLPEHAAYYLQQCAEKLLKAYLRANDAEIEKTHNLDSLLLSASGIEPALAKLKTAGLGSSRVSTFATYYRYPNPDKIDTIASDEIEGAVEFVVALDAALRPLLGDALWEVALQRVSLASDPFMPRPVLAKPRSGNIPGQGNKS